jgi:hypothetical protein
VFGASLTELSALSGVRRRPLDDSMGPPSRLATLTW